MAETTHDAKATLASKDPFELFKVWFEEACQHPQIKAAQAMNIATASKDGYPTARMVVLQDFSSKGFRFSTSRDSEKGKQLQENPRAALTFYWEALGKQIRINGNIEKLSEDESDKIFYSVPVGLQIGVAANLQSIVIENETVLEENKKSVTARFENQAIPRPDFWTGYILRPERFEFWEQVSKETYTFHRIRFRHASPGELLNDKLTKHGANDWLYEMLSP